jgi:gluconate 5-dehydrogenase
VEGQGVSSAGRFDGRVCIVTGGGRGIGRGIALGLAAEGASVGVVARTRAQCEAVAGAIGDQALPVPADATDHEACERAVAQVTERFGRVSVLVNAAGVSPVRQRAELHDVEAWRRILEVNLTGAYLMTRAASTGLLDGGGSVVMVSSVTGATSSPRLAAYGASKAGLTQLTRTLAREWADRGVRVNAVSPGYVETEMTEGLLGVERLRNEIVASTPLGRIGRIEEVVAPALFLASEEASYITGAELLVDGGMAS